MKGYNTWKTLVLIFITILMVGDINTQIIFGQTNIFDATISTQKDYYHIYEEIIVTYSFSSHVTEDDYFAIGVANNISFDYFHQSSPIQGNFSVSQEYRFILSMTNYTFSGKSVDLYILLYYYDELFGNEICCYTSITVEKLELNCDSPLNNSYLKPNFQYNFTFSLSSELNSNIVPINQPLQYKIFFNEVLSEEKIIFTNNVGGFKIALVPNPRVQLYCIKIFKNESQYFTRLCVTIHLILEPKDPTLRNVILIISIVLGSSVACTGSVYGCVVLYKRRIQKKFEVKKLKI